MAYLDRNLKNFIEAVDARMDKAEYKKKRGELRRNSFGFPREFQLHHIIPMKISSHWVVYQASRAGWKINDDRYNGLPLPANIEDSALFDIPCHCRYNNRDHRDYTEKVARLLDEMETQGKNKWSDRRVCDELEKLVVKIIDAIREMRGGQYIDDINFSTSGGSCYIATATLTGGGSESQLNVLRAWRDRVMTATSFGKSLEAFYDQTSPVVANRVKQNSILANSFLYPFVKPAVWLVEQRSQHPRFAIFYDLAIYAVFLTGLAYGTLVYIFYHFYH